MTVKHDSEGNGVVRLGARDWIYVVVLVCSAATGVMFRMDYVENRIDTKFETWRSEWAREAPSPAMWTKDAIARHDRELAELRAMIKEIAKARGQ